MRASPLTLGELLYADPTITCITEKDWVALVRAIASGEQAALRVLLEKTHAIVFTYLLRLTRDRASAELLILDVFQDIWCEAPVFDVTNGPVLGWIMRRARSSALAHADGREYLQSASDDVVGTSSDLLPGEAGNRRDPADARLQVALEALSVYEREAMEAALLDGLSFAELAARSGESIGTIRSRIRSGLSKMSKALQERGDGS